MMVPIYPSARQSVLFATMGLVSLRTFGLAFVGAELMILPVCSSLTQGLGDKKKR
jgi:transposase